MIFFLLLPILLPLVAPTSKLVFNPQKAKDFWFYSSASYCSKDKLSVWKTSTVSEAYPNLIDIEVIYNPDTVNQAYTAYDKDRNLGFIAFRGTVSSLNNWLENFSIIRNSVEEYCAGCEVHSGYLKDFRGMKSQVRTALLNLKSKHPKAEIAFIGHSMGAALATLTFVDLYQEINPDYFYVYGMPRTGNQAFVDFVDRNFPEIMKVRVNHYKDIVPRIPAKTLGYRHFKTEVFYYEKDSTNFVICQGNEDDSCIDKYMLADFSITDHRLLFGLNMHEYMVNCQ